MSYPEESYISIIDNFQIDDLQKLLESFCDNVSGRKDELKKRALDLLRKKPLSLNYQAYLAKISELHFKTQHNYHEVLKITNHGQQRMPTSMQQPQTLKLENKPPLNQQQSIHASRAVKPLLIPQSPRSNYQHSLPRNNDKIYTYIGLVNPRNVVTPVLYQQQVKKVATDHSLPHEQINVKKFIPTAQLLANVKVKKLPFYENIADIIKLSVLTGSEIGSTPKVVKGMKQEEFSFKLVPEHINYISMHRDVSDGKNEYPYQFQIRIFLIEPNSTEISDHFPSGLNIRINGRLCLSTSNTQLGTEAKQTGHPIDCTQLFKLSPNTTNKISVKWNSDSKTYLIAMYLVKKITSLNLLLKLLDKRCLSSEETKNYIIKKLENVDPDLSTTSYQFSLLCPLAKKRMEIPAKSINCKHLQCFDVIQFILMNEQKPTWMCPTCMQPCIYDDLQIQSYFWKVVSSPNLPDSCKEIEILADGTWRVCDGNEELVNTAADVNENPIDIVNLVDSDEENSTENKKEPIHNPESSNKSGNLQSFVVDLTLSDDEETPKEKSKQENEAKATDDAQQVTSVDLKQLSQVQPHQAGTS